MVTVAWQQERGASYNVSVFPQVLLNMSGPTTLQLTLAYNTLYTVTIATIVCGRTLSTTVTQLHYGALSVLCASVKAFDICLSLFVRS